MCTIAKQCYSNTVGLSHLYLHCHSVFVVSVGSAVLMLLASWTRYITFLRAHFIFCLFSYKLHMWKPQHHARKRDPEVQTLLVSTHQWTNNRTDRYRHLLLCCVTVLLDVHQLCVWIIKTLVFILKCSYLCHYIVKDIVLIVYFLLGPIEVPLIVESWNFIEAETSTLYFLHSDDVFELKISKWNICKQMMSSVMLGTPILLLIGHCPLIVFADCFPKRQSNSTLPTIGEFISRTSLWLVYRAVNHRLPLASSQECQRWCFWAKWYRR